MLRRTAGDAIGMECVGSGGAVPVDPNQLETALLNRPLNSQDTIIASGTARGCLTIEATNTTLELDDLDSRNEVLRIRTSWSPSPITERA